LPLDFAEDALNETVERLAARSIRPDVENPALRLGYVIVRNVCIDEARDRYGDSRTKVEPEQWKNTGTVLEVLLTSWFDPRPEDVLHNRRQLRAVYTGFDVLPLLVARRFPKAGQYLELVWRVAVSSDSTEEEAALTPAERQQLGRGRELLRGWLDRMCHTSKGPGKADERYYKAAYEAAEKYIKDEEE